VEGGGGGRGRGRGGKPAGERKGGDSGDVLSCSSLPHNFRETEMCGGNELLDFSNTHIRAEAAVYILYKRVHSDFSNLMGFFMQIFGSY
jgi:hypothetical protein